MSQGQFRAMSANFLGWICLGCFIAALHWNTFRLPLIRDEGEYAYAAWLLRTGDVPYAHSFLQKPPMIVYTYALALCGDDGSGVAVRGLAIVAAFCAALLLGKIGRQELGQTEGTAAAWLLGPLLLLPNLDQFTANTEQFLIVPLLGTWFTYSRNKGQAKAQE